MGFFVRISELPRKIKILIMLGIDFILLPLAFWSAVCLRLGTWSPQVEEYEIIFFVVPIITIPIFIRIGLYRAVVRYIDEKFLLTVFSGVTLSTLLLTAFVAFARLNSLPRSSLLIFWIFSFAYIAATRLFARGMIRTVEFRKTPHRNVAIYGAGRAGTQLSFALSNSREYRPVAFFDDDLDLQGTLVSGIKIYSPNKINEVIFSKNVEEVILAIPSMSRSLKRTLVEKLKLHNVIVKTLPGLAELVDGKLRVEDVREVGIEDLLGRDTVPADEILIRNHILSKVVMVTGAGGSIGSELCRQVCKNNPKKMILVESSELALYQIEKEILQHFPRIDLVSYLANVTDQKQMESLFKKETVQIVYHAAAYKHVPLVELNANEGIKNNSIGTQITAELALAHQVEKFILISTDKAVRPTNIMGASKRMAEMILQAMAAQSPQGGTIFSMVRFGNVLGSSGSVVPLFKEQIRVGGPVTVTHPEMIRYFMTIPEAAELVIQAGAMSRGGEVFILDMGEPVKIYDLACRMIHLSGLSIKSPDNPQGDIEIQFTGLRPGEKLFEELLIDATSEKTDHPSVFKAKEAYEKLEKIEAFFEFLKAQPSDLEIKQKLKEIVKEYLPQNS